LAALRASPLDNQSLPQAIESLVNECRAAGIATAFTVRGESRDLPPQIDLVLYRVAQEGMTNMCKHAQASSAEVELDYREKDQIRLTVRDSGVGTDDPSGGYGLVGVRERRTAGVRQTRATLANTRRAVDAYMADHDGGCPSDLTAVM